MAREFTTFPLPQINPNHLNPLMLKFPANYLPSPLIFDLLLWC